MPKVKRQKKTCRTNIGGQAVLEGVMMMGKSSMATAVRDENKNIQVEAKRIKPNSEKSVWRRVPFVRGVLNFVTTMYQGVGIILRSSEVFEGEAEPSKFEKWCSTKLHLNVMSVMMGVAVILGLALSIGLFFVLPHFALVGLKLIPGADTVHPIVFSIVEGVIRILIFVAYIGLTSLMKEIKRVYMYHGSEHKTISCYEYGLDLTVENVQKQTTIHDRCGTTFMFIVMVISILVFAIATGFLKQAVPMWAQLLIKLALLPVVAGISYEILKFLAKFDNWFVRLIKAPGLLLQKVTTKQPTDDMVEVAITAFKTVLAMDADPTIPETRFDSKIMYSKARKQIEDKLAGIEDVSADIDWIMCEVLGIKRSELATTSYLRTKQLDKMMVMVDRRKAGEPLQQILGNTDFYGVELNVTSDTLCPRPETEYLVEEVIKIINAGNKTSLLDLCTGSGAIAIVVKTKCPNVAVTASDISNAALEVARGNIAKNAVEIEVIHSDLFENIDGKYDIIVSNPPYIKTSELATLDPTVVEHEPTLALDGGEDGLDYYRAIIAQASEHLNANGYLAFEVGIAQAVDVVALMQDNYQDVVVRKDLEGVDRIVIGQLK